MIYKLPRTYLKAKDLREFLRIGAELRLTKEQKDIIQMMITEREHYADSFSPDGYRYLGGLPADIQEKIIRKVKSGGKNLYHSIMAVISNHTNYPGKYSLTEAKSAYWQKYGSGRDFGFTPADVAAVYDYCYKAYLQKGGKNPYRAG